MKNKNSIIMDPEIPFVATRTVFRLNDNFTASEPYVNLKLVKTRVFSSPE